MFISISISGFVPWSCWTRALGQSNESQIHIHAWWALFYTHSSHTHKHWRLWSTWGFWWLTCETPSVFLWCPSATKTECNLWMYKYMLYYMSTSSVVPQTVQCSAVQGQEECSLFKKHHINSLDIATDSNVNNAKIMSSISRCCCILWSDTDIWSGRGTYINIINLTAGQRRTTTHSIKLSKPKPHVYTVHIYASDMKPRHIH